MADYAQRQSTYGGVDSSHQVSGWAVGFISFAAMLMLLIGGFHIFTGLVAIIDNNFFVTPREYLTDFSVNTWGWVHLIGGIVLFMAGLGLLGGSVWARVLGVLLALISALVNFAFIPYYPVWSILMIALSIGVMWALMAHGRDVAELGDPPR